MTNETKSKKKLLKQMTVDVDNILNKYRIIALI